MGAEKESGSDGPGNAGEPPPCGAPRPVACAEESSPLAAKLAKLAENLSAGRALAQKELTDGAPTAPALITSGSLFEAKAYLASVEPVNGDEPITMEMQRIRIAEEVNAATWVTERIERVAQEGGERKEELPPSSAAVAGDDGSIGSEIGADAGAQERKRASNKAAFVGVLVAGLAAAGAGYALFARQEPSGVDVLYVQAAEVANATLFEQMEAMGLMSDEEVASAKALALGPAASGGAQPGISAASRLPLPARPPAPPPIKGSRGEGDSSKAPGQGSQTKGAGPKSATTVLVTKDKAKIPVEMVQ